MQISDKSQSERTVVAETEWMVFKQSPIHGVGGFARADIRKDTRVIEYLGEKISKQESLQRCEQNNEYVFMLSEREDLDGNVEWNPARFINHSCSPNCEALLENERIWIVSVCDIKQGDEITFNYGFDLEDYRDYPCHCGSSNCIGFIVAEAFFEHVRRQLEHKLQ
jgi:SET domain-containing protein